MLSLPLIVVTLVAGGMFLLLYSFEFTDRTEAIGYAPGVWSDPLAQTSLAELLPACIFFGGAILAIGGTASLLNLGGMLAALAVMLPIKLYRTQLSPLLHFFGIAVAVLAAFEAGAAFVLSSSGGSL